METVEQVNSPLSDLIEANLEWLLVRAGGRTFPLRRSEIDVVADRSRLLLELVAEGGATTFRINSFAAENGEIRLDVTGSFGRNRETIRLVPRVAAGRLAAEVELARLARANEAGGLIETAFPGTKIIRITLRADNGRVAQISLETADRQPAAALVDVTGTLSPELLLTTAVLALRESRRRRKPVTEIWVIGAKKQAAALQKMLAMLTAGERASYRVFEISRTGDENRLSERGRQKLSDLWREKPKKISLPPAAERTDTARRILALDPENIDLVASRQGETLRYLGLPFARVRRVMGRERVWFGIEKERRPLTSENWEDLVELVADLRQHRSAAAANRRHELYRAAPEAWLESLLRRNIRLLDPNLTLSPLYSQFRAASDKIDLLAIRRDGRLVVVELKTSPDRECVFQAADYWRKIELQRRRGALQKARAFGDVEILDEPALVYVAAPALSFHRDFAEFARMLATEVELWRFELHEDWRSQIRVLSRRNYRYPLK